MPKNFKTIHGSSPYGNQQKLLWHMDRLCEFHKTGSTFPIQVELCPTNVCNMGCKFCIAKSSRNKDSIPMDNLVTFLRDFREMGGKSIDWTGGGEPTLYKWFGECTAIAETLGYRQGLMTNGSFDPKLIPDIASRFDWVRVSLDCVNPSAYSDVKRTGPDVLGRVLNNIGLLCAQDDRHSRVVANVNLGTWNHKYLIDTIEESKKLGCDAIQIRPILPGVGERYSDWDMRFYQTMANNLSDIQRRGTDDFQVIVSWDKFNDILIGKIYDREYASCCFHNFVVTLAANGDLRVCSHRADSKNVTFGNICKEPLADIWNGKRRKKVMKACTDMDFEKCQVCCKLHEGNKFLHFIKNNDGGSDPDFF